MVMETLLESGSESCAPDMTTDLQVSEAADHPDVFGFKTASEFSLPVSLIHVTHHCTVAEHKIWLCLLSHASEIIKQQKLQLSAETNINFRIPVDVILFKTGSTTISLKTLSAYLERLKGNNIKIDLLNKQGYRSITSHFNFINDFSLISNDQTHSTNLFFSDMEDESEIEAEEEVVRTLRNNLSKIEVVYSLPSFFTSIIQDTISVQKLTHLFSWTNILSLTASGKKAGKNESLLYCLLESLGDKTELDFETFKAYLGYLDPKQAKRPEDRYLIRDSIKPAISNFNENELMSYTIEYDFIRGRYKKIDKIILEKKYKTLTNEVESKQWHIILNEDIPIQEKRILIKQILPTCEVLDNTDSDLKIVIEAVKDYIKSLKKKNRLTNYIGVCRKGFNDQWGLSGKTQQTTIVGDEQIANAARSGVTTALGKNPLPLQRTVNPLENIAKKIQYILSLLAMNGGKKFILEAVDQDAYDNFVLKYSEAFTKFNNKLLFTPEHTEQVVNIVFSNEDVKVNFNKFDKVNFNYVLSASIALFVYSTVISQDIKAYSEDKFRQPDSMRKIIEDIINYIDSNC